MTTRAELALSVCAGLTDKELAERGAGSFAKMISRKRQYAAAARQLAASSSVINAELAQSYKNLARAQEDLAQAQENIIQLEAMNMPVGDTAEAAAMIDGIIKSSKE